MENCFYPANQAIFNLEQLGNLPGPVDLHMIEKSEGKYNAVFTIYCDEAAIPDPRNDVKKLSGFKLLLAVRLGGLHAVTKQPLDFCGISIHSESGTINYSEKAAGSRQSAAA